MEGQTEYKSFPNIIVSRYEGDKKGGFVGINDNGTTPFLNRVIYADILRVENLDRLVIAEYTINGFKGSKYDFKIYEGITYLDFINFSEGQEIYVIAKNSSFVLGLFVVSGVEQIKWLNNDLPSVITNAKLSFYKSDGIIYAEIKKPYIGGLGSGSDYEDNDCCLNKITGVGTKKITISETEPVGQMIGDIWIDPI